MKPEPTLAKQAFLVAGWIIVLLILALLTPNPANAQTVEMGFSAVKHESVEDDIWFTKHGDYPYHNDLTGSGYVLGLADNFQESNWGWRVWAIDFGKTSNHAVWSKDEQAYLRGNYSLPAYYEGEGSGRAYGLSAGLTLRYPVASSFHIIAEGGALLYRAEWTETVRNVEDPQWSHMDKCPDCAGAHVGVTWYLGAGFSWSKAFVTFRQYQNIHAHNSVFDGQARQVVAGLRTSF